MSDGQRGESQEHGAEASAHGPHLADGHAVSISCAESTFLRHAISVALRSSEFDDTQRAALLGVSERLAAGGHRHEWRVWSGHLMPMPDTACLRCGLLFKEAQQ